MSSLQEAALAGLVALALPGANVVLVHAPGAMFFLTRLSHLLGFGMDVWARGRVVGVLFTKVTLFATAIALFMLAFG